MDLNITQANKNHGFLSRNALKYFAVICMVCDHIAYGFVDAEPLRTVLLFVGGFTMPIMAFFLAEGCFYTKNMKKYALRLLLFALISVAPFTFFQNETWMPVEILKWDWLAKTSDICIPLSEGFLVVHRANFLFTLLLSLLNIAAWDKLKIPVPFKVVITAVICWLSTGCDWGYWCILISFVFWKFRENNVLKWVLYSLVCVSCVFGFKVFRNPLLMDITYSFTPVRLVLFFVIPLIAICYNGKKGSGGSFGKWFFYIFYPAHLFVICLILIWLM